MTHRLSVATGPPGTGKTALVTALCATAEAAGQSVLVASTNNRAVDGVCEKLDDIAPGMVIRTGRKSIENEIPEKLDQLLRSTRQPTVDAPTAGGRVRTVQKKIDTARAALDARNAAETDLYAVNRHLARITPDHRPEALAVLEADDRQLDRAAVLAQRSLLRWPLGFLARRTLRKRFGASDTIDRQRLGELFDTARTRREIQADLESMPKTEEVWGKLKQLLEERVEFGRDYAQAVAARRIGNGAAAIRARISLLNQRESNWIGFDKLLKHLPGWAITGHSSTAIVPRPALFDLVIIDEAAQCATPIVLALLMRARRALIIGDPNQLQPVVKLSKDEEDELRRTAGLGAKWLRSRRLGFVGESIYSACSAVVGEELLLDEHYRCDPSIVAAPNQVVYQNRLTVLTDRNRLALPAEPPDEPAVEIIDVPGTAESPSNRSCRNTAEAVQVVDHAAKILTEYGQLSVGIVTPFVAQRDLIRTMLAKRGFAVKDADGRERVGTIHTFQGDERDVILLSPVGAPGITPGSAKWVRNETNLWNVAITRGKSRLVVVCHRGWWSGGSGLLSRLVDRTEDELIAEHADQDLGDLFQDAVHDAGIPIVKRHTVIAGQPCDLLVDGVASALAVVIDDASTPDGRRHRQLLARLDLIEAAGYRAVRVPAWQVLAEPETVASQLTAGN